jgi:hypothetical protein
MTQVGKRDIGNPSIFDAFKRSRPASVTVDHEELSQSLFELQNTMRRAMEELAKGELTSMVQVQIVRELLNGRRTVAELAEALFGLRQGDEGYLAQYYQIDKELRLMGSRGLVSRRPFGRDKPYALTQHAVARLTMMGSVKRSLPPKAVSVGDLALYGLVMVLGVVGAWFATGGLGTDVPILVIAFAFMFAGGAAFCRFVETILRVA